MTAVENMLKFVGKFLWLQCHYDNRGNTFPYIYCCSFGLKAILDITLSFPTKQKGNLENYINFKH